MVDSVLFCGLRFDQKRFATDVERFKRRGSDGFVDGERAGSISDSQPACPAADSSSAFGNEPENEIELRALDVQVRGHTKKKRKITGPSTSHGSDFDVFRPPSIAVPRAAPPDNTPTERHRKSVARVVEEAAVLRKKLRLHVAGQSVAAPIARFEQLRAQYPLHYAAFL